MVTFGLGGEITPMTPTEFVPTYEVAVVRTGWPTKYVVLESVPAVSCGMPRPVRLR